MYEDMIKIHSLLHQGDFTALSRMGVRAFKVHNERLNFTKGIISGGVQYLTQNMNKNSTWTHWVNTKENRTLTWRIKNNHYTHRIQSENGITYVYQLNPELLIEVSNDGSSHNTN